MASHKQSKAIEGSAKKAEIDRQIVGQTEFAGCLSNLNGIRLLQWMALAQAGDDLLNLKVERAQPIKWGFTSRNFHMSSH